MLLAELKSSIITIAIIISTLSAQAAAATLNVDGADSSCSDTTGTPYCTIQAAIDAAVDTDTVLVMPDTYQENINFKGKAITVRSDQGPSVTIIDGGRNDTVAYFGNGETSDSVLDGFTLQNGFAGLGKPLADLDGGGILIQNTSPTIRNNVITDNIADVPGFGIHVYLGSPIIDGNTISSNRASGRVSGGGGGGGIALLGGGSAQIINNTIINHDVTTDFNGGGGIDLWGAGTPTIRNNFISGNTGGFGGGICMMGASNALIVQNVILDNTATDRGGGIYWIVPSGEPGPTVLNNTIVNNSSPEDAGVYANGFDASTELTNNLIITYSGLPAVYCGDLNDINPPIFNSNNIYSQSGAPYAGICSDQTGLNGNISADPLFLDIYADDFRLEPLSPAINKGDGTAPDLPATDFAGNTRIVGSEVDMGAYEYVPNPGFLEFSAITFSANESTLVATIRVRRRAGDLGAITVDFSTGDNTARAGSDYTATSGTITFSDGDMAEKSFSVPILDDKTGETTEFVNLTLSNPTGGATLGTVSTATLLISDNDATLPSSPFSIGEGEGSSGCFITTAIHGGPM